MADQKRRGQIKQAPENFLSQELIADLNENGMDDARRGFLRKGFMAALGCAVGVGSSANVLAADGDPVILEKQEWQTTLGKNVATMPYGMPSIYEANLIQIGRAHV